MRADAQVYVLGTALSATGAAIPIRGGDYMFMGNGTLSGATVSLQMQQADGSTWCDVSALAGNSIVKSTTAPVNITPVTLPAGNVRVALTGGTPTGVSAWLAGIG